jgi:Icc-related predicted phosphoesterase
MTACLFVSDLHGSPGRFDKLLDLVRQERPQVLFLGGDLLPFGGSLPTRGRGAPVAFVQGFVAPRLSAVRHEMGRCYPRVVVIPGNDDPRREEASLRQLETAGLWTYLHNRKVPFEGYRLYGYSCIPPSPFLLKDWERYDVSRFVDVGSVAPSEGFHSAPPDPGETESGTILQDLEALAGEDDLSRSVFLFHAPPYGSALDRAGLDGSMIEQAPLDVHVGSIAVRRFIERRRPYVSLHGHVHESVRLTRRWRERIGGTWCFGAAHDGPELAVVRFALERPEAAERLLL